MPTFTIGDRVTADHLGDRITGTYRGECSYSLDGCHMVQQDSYTTPSHVPANSLALAEFTPDVLTTLTAVPDDVKVVKNLVSGTRRYLIRTGYGDDGWSLSDNPEFVDTSAAGGFSSRPWREAHRYWFRGEHKTGVGNQDRKPSDWMIVKRYPVSPVGLAESKEEEKTVTAQEFIGARPETQGPKYQTPFQLSDEDDSTIVDGLGHTVVTIDLEHDYQPGDDRRMSEAIVSALNEKFDPAPAPAKLRTVYKTVNGRADGDVRSLAFEVRPGKFWHASNRAEAEREASDGRGWPTERGEGFYDLETGQEIVTYEY